jgi:hypothetical protein
MNAVFRYRAPLGLAYTRRARLIVEALDPVTLELIGDGLTMSVEGMEARPVISTGGRHVWFEEPGHAPAKLRIDPGNLPYMPLEMAVPPLPPPPPPPAKPQTWNVMHVELAPSTAYPFAAGITGFRGSFIVNAADDPQMPLKNTDVRLQWIDDNQAGEVWVDAPNLSHTSANGDFVALVRLGPSQIARADAQKRMRVRVAATHAGITRLTPELPIPFNRITDAQQSFAWEAL